MYTGSIEPGYMNFRGQGQWSTQGQMTKMTYFSTKRSVISIKTNFDIQLAVYHV